MLDDGCNRGFLALDVRGREGAGRWGSSKSRASRNNANINDGHRSCASTKAESALTNCVCVSRHISGLRTVTMRHGFFFDAGSSSQGNACAGSARHRPHGERIRLGELPCWIGICR
jgi:hypothetical protein